MKRQRESSPSAGSDDDAVHHDAFVSGGTGARNPSRLVQQQQEIERSMAPTSTVAMPSFCNFGLLNSIRDEFSSAQANETIYADSSLQPFVNFLDSAQATVPLGLAKVAALTGDEFSPIYAGNIAAACEAANQEVAQRHKEPSHDDNEEIQRKKATSRIVAWQSRERKRIEMEVLQERKAELTKRNAILTSENKQLKLMIAHVKAVPSNAFTPLPFAQPPLFSGSTLSWTGSGLADMSTSRTKMLAKALHTQSEAGRESTQASPHTFPPLFQVGHPAFGYPSGAGTVNGNPFFFTTTRLLQQGEPPSQQQDKSVGLSLADSSGLQQGVQTQRRKGSQGTTVPLQAASRTLVGSPEVTPLSRLQSTFQGQQPPGVEMLRYSILPHPRQPEDLYGTPPFDITSLLLPQGNLHVDVPLIRAVPKRTDTDDTKKHHQDNKKNGV
jgi:hypothetical protein